MSERPVTLPEPQRTDEATESTPPRPRASRYSRFVKTMKIVLPVSALALVVLLLAYSGLFQEREPFEITFQEVEAVSEDLRMVNPRVSGTDSDGRPYVITASAATQAADDPDRVSLENIEADWTLDEEGGWLSLSARSGLMQRGQETLELFDEISVFSDDGYEWHGTTAFIDLNAGTMKSEAPVRAQGPLGTLEADGMETLNESDTVRFTGGVKVVVFPNAEGL